MSTIRSDPSGNTGGSSLKLGQEDRRKLYGLLDAEVPARLRRMELALALVVPSNLALLWRVFGEPTPIKTAAALIRGLLG